MTTTPCKLCEKNNPYFLINCPQCHFLVHLHVEPILQMPHGGKVSVECPSCGHVLSWEGKTREEILIDLVFVSNAKAVKHEPY